MSGEPEPALYYAFWQTPSFYITGVVRTTADSGTVMRAIRERVASVDPQLPVFHLRPMRDAVDASAAPQQLAARVVGGFAIAALLLAMIGIYGVIAFAVRDRQRELGIRMALGASGLRLVGLVVGDGLALVAIGVGAGVFVAIAGSRVLRGLLFGVEATDIASYLAASAVLVSIALIAACIAGRRAAKVDPMIAMRPE